MIGGRLDVVGACRSFTQCFSCGRVATATVMSSCVTAHPRCSRSKKVSSALSHGRTSSRSCRIMVGSVATPEQLLKVYDYDALTESDTKKLIQRPRIDFSAILDTVRLLSSCLEHTLSWLVHSLRSGGQDRRKPRPTLEFVNLYHFPVPGSVREVNLAVVM